MSVRRSTWIAAVVGVSLVVLFGIFLVRQSVEVARAVDAVAKVYDPAAAQAALLDTAISDMQRGVSTYLLTGSEDSLAPYVNGARRSDLALQQLDRLLDDDEQLQGLAVEVGLDRQLWIDEVSRPTIDFKRSGDMPAALATFDSPQSQDLYLSLQGKTATLQALIQERGRTAFNDLAGLGYRLVLAVLASATMLGVFLVLTFALARGKILAPLDRLSQQIRLVARRGEHTRTIQPDGPEELRAVGADVELLRRYLVAEIDEARASREALEQKAPVVTAIRSELSAGSAVDVPGLAIHGELQPAEGVLAGDWWDSTILPTGEAALLVADISGHGPAAGIAAMQLKYAIVHELLADVEIDEMAASAAELFQRHPDRFATVAAVCVDPASGHVRYVNAGHHAPLIIDADGQVVQRLERTGPVLSWLGGQWEVGTAQLHSNDTVLLYSDGLIESHDMAGEELGEEQLEQWLAVSPANQRAPVDLVPWLIGAARERAVDWSRDDVTVVAIRWEAPGPTTSTTARLGSRMLRAGSRD